MRCSFVLTPSRRGNVGQIARVKEFAAFLQITKMQNLHVKVIIRALLRTNELWNVRGVWKVIMTWKVMKNWGKLFVIIITGWRTLYTVNVENPFINFIAVVLSLASHLGVRLLPRTCWFLGTCRILSGVWGIFEDRWRREWIGFIRKNV